MTSGTGGHHNSSTTDQNKVEDRVEKERDPEREPIHPTATNRRKNAERGPQEVEEEEIANYGDQPTEEAEGRAEEGVDAGEEAELPTTGKSV